MARPSVIPSEYYGDSTRWFIATVVSNQAPVGYEGRIKIRVHGLHSASQLDIPESDLPWAQCILPTTEGGVSGLGRIPRLQPSALVFGFFMDGTNSQTPIILGSIPHIELPSEIQLGQPKEDVGQETPEGFWNNVVEVFRPKNVDIDDDNTGNINGLVKSAREQTAIGFFLNLGYTLNQTIGIVSSISYWSGMRTGINVRGKGLAGWSDVRWSDLKAFSNDYLKFTKQLEFIAYELKTTESQANIRLLDTKNIEGRNGSVETFVKYYTKRIDTRVIKQTELSARRLRDRI